MPRRLEERREEVLTDRLPVDVLPYSNGEYIPRDPTRGEVAIMKVAREDCGAAAKRHGMSRRSFMQTSAATAICFGAINKVMGRGYAVAADPDPSCLEVPLGRQGSMTQIPLEHPGAQLANLPGEFIMDLQSHHVDSGGSWRAVNPGEAAFFAAVFGGSICKSAELDPIECIGRVHYVKELFLDSATNICVLSAVPYQPNGQPLPVEEAAKTAELVNGLAGTRRVVMHRFVMPNRGSLGNKSDGTIGKATQDAGTYVPPVFLQEELDLMTHTAETYGGAEGPFRAWKVYTPWGDVPFSSGWWLDDPCGRAFIEHAIALSAQHDVPAMICAHKGFALPAFEQAKAATRDVGIVARDYPEATFVIYHSGYDGDTMFGLGTPLNQGTSASSEYPGPEAAPSINRGVDNLITSLVENGWSARHFALGKQGTPGLQGNPAVAGSEGEYLAGGHANVPNVYAELGSVWSAVMKDPLAATWLLTKLVWYVGPERITWGTDCLWSGSPQPYIDGLRLYNARVDNLDPGDPVQKQIRDLLIKYRMPWGLDGDRSDPEKDTLDSSSYGDGQMHPERSIRNGILGYNAAGPYRITPAEIAAVTNVPQSVRDAQQPPLIPCSELQKLRDEYVINPLASHRIWGPRTRRELFASLREDPWFRGARRMQNDRGFLKRIG